ncbi:hypothetical protein P3T43_007055 [Paraburkholderia sp. GAS41]
MELIWEGYHLMELSQESFVRIRDSPRDLLQFGIKRIWGSREVLPGREPCWLRISSSLEPWEPWEAWGALGGLGRGNAAGRDAGDV